jgi:D-alanyl-lipoteichoic acid acyltransferase DltB (MBOAT superfamily)
MAFNSLHFLVFFPIVVAVYFLVHSRWRWAVLFVASCYFYMAWRPEYIVLILGESALVYGAALALAGSEKTRRGRWILGGCIVALVGVLFAFKYLGFFIGSVEGLITFVGIPWALDTLPGWWRIEALARAPLPLGISFHTFILIGYLLDVYHGKMAAVRHAGVFGTFTVFFPILVAGPIERAPLLVPQFLREQKFDYQRTTSGLRLMAWGFFKKLVVADTIAPFVEQVYAAPRAHDGQLLMLGTVFFAFQIYCDFSAYTDIARGAAKILGISLMENFRQPYFATSISDFWKRWHISLSTWLTDYVYSAFTRASWLKLKWYPKFLASLFLTFLVSGIWHGAAWTYVVWGALHGVYLISSMLTQKVRRRAVTRLGLDQAPALHTVLRVAFTFALVCLSYVFFRAGSLGDAVYIVTHLFADAQQPAIAGPSALFVMMGFFLVGVVIASDVWALYGNVDDWIVSRPVWVRWAAYHAFVVVTAAFSAPKGATQFIYFQF